MITTQLHVLLLHVQWCSPSAPPVPKGSPGRDPSGSPAVPKISRSMASLPGLAPGTLQQYAHGGEGGHTTLDTQLLLC